MEGEAKWWDCRSSHGEVTVASAPFGPNEPSVMFDGWTSAVGALLAGTVEVVGSGRGKRGKAVVRKIEVEVYPESVPGALCCSL